MLSSRRASSRRYAAATPYRRRSCGDPELAAIALEATLPRVQAHEGTLGDRDCTRRLFANERRDDLAVPLACVSDVERRVKRVVLPIVRRDAESFETEVDGPCSIRCSQLDDAESTDGMKCIVT